jgi:hypothetical protein
LDDATVKRIGEALGLPGAVVSVGGRLLHGWASFLVEDPRTLVGPSWRWPVTDEDRSPEEEIGRRRGFSAPADKKRSREAKVCPRAALLAGAPHGGGVAWFWGLGATVWGWNLRPVTEEVLERCRVRLRTPRREEEPPRVPEGTPRVRPDPEEATSMRTPEVLQVAEILRRVDGRGTDVRLDLGSCHRAKVWPREAVNPKRWLWRDVQEYGWKHPRHINVLELEAAVLHVMRRMREAKAIGCRFVHLTDSQVVAGVVAKGRSSSRKLNVVVRRLGGLLLGCHGRMVVAWCKTAENPADGPSRRWKLVRKKGSSKYRRVRA